MSINQELNLEKADTLLKSLSLLRVKELSTEEEYRAFYVPASDARNADEQDRTEKILLSIKTSATPCHILFTGHMGCGKSTEIRRLGRMLRSDGYLFALGICDENLDMNSMQYTDLILFILETLLQCAKDNDLTVRDDILANIESYWKAEYEDVIKETKGSGFSGSAAIEAKSPSLLSGVLSFVASFRSFFQIQSEKCNTIRRKIEPRLKVFFNLANDLIDDIQKAGVKNGFHDACPVVLLDQLEKANRDVASDLFNKYSNELTTLRAHIIVPFPIEMCYSPSYNQIKNYYSEEWVLPMIKLRTWDDATRSYMPCDAGKEVLREIILRRMDERLLADGVLDIFIEKTGGYLRDLFSAIFDAALNAAVRKSEIIETEDMTVALNKLQSSVSRRFSEKSRKMLERILDGDKHYAFDEELLEAIRSGAVLEYNGERWVDLHPLAAEWLEKTRKSKTYFINNDGK